MRIEKLIVKATKPSESIIREICFKAKGLSLIVDNTTSTANERDNGESKATAIVNESGNSVGKTTAIKIIDLCLGAKSVKELYYDPDTRSENVEIKEFLIKNKVQAELTLISESEERTTLTRDLFLHGKKYIQNIEKTEHEYWEKLKRILFGLVEPNPTFRQLIPKFVRLSNTSEDSMIKFLPSMTTKDTYDTVYSFLFDFLGTDMVNRKDELVKQLSDCQKAISMLEKNKSISSISVLRQKEEIIDHDLLEYSQKRNNLSYIEDYKEEIDNKRKLTSKINDLEEKSQLLDFEITTIKESLAKLENEKSNVNLSLLEKVYREAEGYIPKLQKNFKDVVAFHNTMIENRIEFIDKQLRSKKEEFDECLKKIDIHLSEKERATIEILDEGLLSELNILNRKIEDLSVQKGEIKQSIKLLEEQDKMKIGFAKELKIIDSEIDGNEIENKLKVFNQIFSDYCDKLYGEKYLLAYNSSWKNEGKFPITLESLGGNVGTGKKKAVIVAFDLAYIKYAAKMNIPGPRFVIHDKLESTHINQLKIIFEICRDIDGQYIIPILRERIDKIDAEFIEKDKVLELSTNDKFFRV